MVGQLRFINTALTSCMCTPLSMPFVKFLEVGGKVVFCNKIEKLGSYVACNKIKVHNYQPVCLKSILIKIIM